MIYPCGAIPGIVRYARATNVSNFRSRTVPSVKKGTMAPSAIEDYYEDIGFSIIPSFMSHEEQEGILRYLDQSLTGSPDEASLSIAKRSSARRAGNIIAVNEQKYGREYYLQTDSFQLAVTEKDGCYCRLPSDSAKHSIPKQSPRLEDEKNKLVKILSDRISALPAVRGDKLYLLQCVHYNGKYERGKHIDNKVNGGDIIVGCSFGDTDRYIELSGICVNRIIFPLISIYLCFFSLFKIVPLFF